MIGFVFQTTLLFAVLYYAPFLGSLSEQIGAIGAVVASVLLSTILYFIWDLIHAPKLLDQYQREDLKSSISIVSGILDSEHTVRSVGRLHEEGAALLSLPFKGGERREAYVAWLKKCDVFLESNFEFSKVHDYRNRGSIGGFGTPASASDILDNQIRGKLAALDSIISYGNMATLSHIKLQYIIDAAKHPSYEFIIGDKIT